MTDLTTPADEKKKRVSYLFTFHVAWPASGDTAVSVQRTHLRGGDPPGRAEQVTKWPPQKKNQ